MIENAICRIFGRGSRRVIIPGMGAFIRKDNGEIIFTDMLRTDDGELVSSVVCTFGISEEKAREIVAHYVSGLKNELKHRGFAEVSGIGVLTVGPQGVCQLKIKTEDDSFRSLADQRGSEDRFVREGMERVEDGLSITADEEGEGVIPDEVSIQENPDAVPGSSSPIDAAPKFLDPAESGEWNENPTDLAEPVKAAESVVDVHTASETTDSSAAGIPVSDNNAFQPVARTDKSRLRSALYGEEDTEEDDALTHGGRFCRCESGTEKADATSAGDLLSGGGSANERYEPRIEIRRPHKPKKRVDGVLIIAIIAMVITLGVLAYGYFTKLNIDRGSDGDILIELSSPADSESISLDASE